MSISDTQHLGTGDLLDDSLPATTAPDSGDELLGATLNNTYIVERLLGEGGMGRVYLACHTRIRQKKVAVKVLHSEFAGNAHVYARFQREAESAAAVSHPNVVTMLDIDVTPRGMPYLVCEYLEGVDLADYLKRVKRLDVAAALSVARQLCSGLGAAHARGVIHRDLKPPNVFLVGDFETGPPERLYTKVLDFGLSRFEATQGENNLTNTGLIMGTPSYMAPEQAAGKRVDHRVDIYGVGTILYKALTGRAPFNEDSPQATMLAVMNSEPPRPRSLVPTIPPHLELIIEQAMAKDPRQRYPDMAALEHALDALSLPDARIQSGAPAALERPQTSLRRARHPVHLEGDVHAARPRLLLVSLSAVLLAICGATAAISGIELASGYTFDRVELRLLLLAIVGSSLTPAILWILRVRRRIWDNSSRVLLLLGKLRAAVFAGIASYGIFLLAFNVLDGFLVRLLERPEVKPIGVAWAGWNLLLPAIALTIAIAVGWRRHVVAKWPPGWRQSLAIWCVTGLALAVVSSLMYGGLLWRASQSAG